MPLRVLLTGKLHGPDIGATTVLLYKAGTSGSIVPQAGFVTFDERFKILRDVKWESFNSNLSLSAGGVTHWYLGDILFDYPLYVETKRNYEQEWDLLVFCTTSRLESKRGLPSVVGLLFCIPFPPPPRSKAVLIGTLPLIFDRIMVEYLTGHCSAKLSFIALTMAMYCFYCTKCIRLPVID